MSERDERRRGRRGRGRPESAHDDVIRLIEGLIDEALAERLPTLGTVRGVAGGRVRVWIDEEEEERSIGFPRKLGQRYRVGDRVLLVPSRSGEWMVAGTVSAAGGAAAQAVGDDELVDAGVSGGKLRASAVGERELANGAVVTGRLADGAVTRAKLAANAVGGNELAGGAVDSGHLAGNAVTRAKIAGGAVGTDQIAQNAVIGWHIAAGTIGTGHLAPGAVTGAKIAGDAVGEAHLTAAVRNKLGGITLPLDSGAVSCWANNSHTYGSLTQTLGAIKLVLKNHENRLNARVGGKDASQWLNRIRE